MEKKDYLKSFYLKDYSMIFAGLILYALGLTGFLLPNKIVTGGLAGITVLIKSTTDIPLWVSYLSINAVLLIVAWKPSSTRISRSIESPSMLTSTGSIPATI